MKFITAFLVALIGSVIVNIGIVSVLGPMVNNPAMPLTALTVMAVSLFTILGTVGATIVYAIMRAMMKNPNKAFIWVAVIVFILSCIPDYLIIGKTSGPFAGGTFPEALVLMVMHLAAAIIITWSLVKLWGAKQMSVSMPAAPMTVLPTPDL